MWTVLGPLGLPRLHNHETSGWGAASTWSFIHQSHRAMNHPSLEKPIGSLDWRPSFRRPISAPDKLGKAWRLQIDTGDEKPFRRCSARTRASTAPCSASAVPRRLRTRAVVSALPPQDCLDPRQPPHRDCSAPLQPALQQRDCSVPHSQELLVRFLPPIRRLLGWRRRLEMHSAGSVVRDQQQGCGEALRVLLR